jgi:hypothetical protein
VPILTPGQATVFTINDLVTMPSGVLQKVENRSTDTAQAWQWVVDALLELSTDRELRNEFDQLEEYGNMFNLTVGQQEYDDIECFVPGGDINTSTLDFLLWIDPPNNTQRRRLDMISYQEADKWQASNAQPIQCYRFSDLIGFYPIPDQTYTVQPRIQRQHPINDTNIGATPILLPRDWNEIICWAAAMRGYADLKEYEASQKIHDLLYGAGDENTAKRSPGMIMRRKKRREQEAWRKEMPLRPVVRTYSWSGR